MFKNNARWEHVLDHTKADEEVDKIGEQLSEFRVIGGLDLGVKYPVAGVICDGDSKEEKNIKYSAKNHYATIGNAKTQRKYNRLTAEFERMRAADSENRQLYPETPSPNGLLHWRDYVKHRLKMSNAAFAAYANKR